MGPRPVIGELERFAYLQTVTLGWLHFGPLTLATIERPWIPNAEGPGGKLRESCVPDGTYNLIPHSSDNFPNSFALINEGLGVYYQARPAGQSWGRTAILIHTGNFVSDVVGCIAVGTRHGGITSVTESRIAMARLRDVLGRDKHTLTIRPQGTQEIAA
jgi:hypothetical protein